MSSARDTVLGRIRDALALAPTPAVVVPRDYRTGRTLPDDERLALFTDRLLDYKARVHPCTAGRTAEVVGDVLREHGVRRMGVPDWTRAGSPGTKVRCGRTTPTSRTHNSTPWTRW